MSCLNLVQKQSPNSVGDCKKEDRYPFTKDEENKYIHINPYKNKAMI